MPGQTPPLRVMRELSYWWAVFPFHLLIKLQQQNKFFQLSLSATNLYQRLSYLCSFHQVTFQYLAFHRHLVPRSSACHSAATILILGPTLVLLSITAFRVIISTPKSNLNFGLRIQLLTPHQPKFIFLSGAHAKIVEHHL